VTPTLPKPDFVAPNDPTDAAEQVQDVKKEDLDAVAKVAAYDRFKAAYEKRRKPGDPEFSVSLEEFLKRAEQPPSARPMRDLGSKVRSNQLSTLSLLPAGQGARLAQRSEPMLSPGGIPADPAATQPDMQGLAPLGVWVSNWADLLPWLAIGYLNAIDDTADAESAIKFRMMMQDFLTQPALPLHGQLQSCHRRRAELGAKRFHSDRRQFLHAAPHLGGQHGETGAIRRRSRERDPRIGRNGARDLRALGRDQVLAQRRAWPRRIDLQQDFANGALDGVVRGSQRYPGGRVPGSDLRGLQLHAVSTELFSVRAILQALSFDPAHVAEDRRARPGRNPVRTIGSQLNLRLLSHYRAIPTGQSDLQHKRIRIHAEPRNKRPPLWGG
jgi:hypothetical protein